MLKEEINSVFNTFEFKDTPTLTVKDEPKRTNPLF